MRNQTLLERQVDLLRYLTRTDFIFGDKQVALAAQEPSLQGMNISHLRLEAEMSFGKRISKIGEVLRQTFRQLGPQREQLFREFAIQHPPETFRRYAEARCFYEFLLRHWQSTPPSPPWVADIAKLEIGQARLRAFRYDEIPVSAEIPPELESKKPLVRLYPAAEVVHMEYDLRALFEQDSIAQAPPLRPHYLLISQMKRGIRARVLEISGGVNEMLEGMRQWIALAQVLDRIPPADSETKAALQRFLQAGVVEVVE